MLHREFDRKVIQRKRGILAFARYQLTNMWIFTVKLLASWKKRTGTWLVLLCIGHLRSYCLGKSRR